ncbi:hypothetical protein ACLOJK_028272 [Asimina triloba]
MSTFDFDYSGAGHHITDRRCRAEDPTKRKQLVGVSIPSSRLTIPKGQQATIPWSDREPPSSRHPRSIPPICSDSVRPRAGVCPQQPGKEADLPSSTLSPWPARSTNDQYRWVETHLNTGHDPARSTSRPRAVRSKSRTSA